MPTVRIPDAFRRYARDRSQVEVAASTAADALESLVALHPDLRERLFDASGRLRPHLSVAVGDHIVPREQLDETPLTDFDELLVVIGLAGG